MEARKDDVPVGRNRKALNSKHIGLVYARQDGRWPTELVCSFRALFEFVQRAMGRCLYACRGREVVRTHSDALRPVLENAAKSGFSNNEAYPIWKGMEEWPKGCSGNRIEAGGSVIGLERLLDEGAEGAGGSI